MIDITPDGSHAPVFLSDEVIESVESPIAQAAQQAAALASAAEKLAHLGLTLEEIQAILPPATPPITD